MDKKIYNFEVRYDFLNQEKSKKITEANILAETETRIICLDKQFRHSEYIQVFNKDKDNRSEIYPDLNKSKATKFKIGDWKDEVYCTIHLTKKPKSEKVIFNKITKVLNKFIQKEYGRYNISFLDFSDVETQRENQQKEQI